MKKVEKIKKALTDNRNSLGDVISEIGLKFTVNEVLNFDSITYNELDYDKKDYSILANESYTTVEDGKTKKKSTRHNIFSMRVSKIKDMEDGILYDMLRNHLKFVKYFNQYKHIHKELELLVKYGYPDVLTNIMIRDFVDFEIPINTHELYEEYLEVRNFYEEENMLIKNYKEQRSRDLDERLVKNKKRKPKKEKNETN